MQTNEDCLKILAIDPGKKLTQFLEMEKEIQVAWAAGLFEGEGYFSISSKKQDICMGLCMTDQDCIEKFTSVIGIGSVKTRQKPNLLWKWEIYKKDDIKEAIDMLIPYLGIRRTAKAEEVLYHIKYKMPGAGRNREDGLRKQALLRAAGFK